MGAVPCGQKAARAKGALLIAGRACDMRSQMDLPLTLALCAGLAALTVGAGWMGARPPNPLKGPRLIPWRMIMLISAAVLMVMLAHLLNLFGVTTGRGGSY